ncbi:MAG: response regulator [Chloroflexota bacterium]
MKQITVLILDDHPEVSSRLAKGLSGIVGFHVVGHTTNPVMAAEFAHQWHPQVIIADFSRVKGERSAMARWLKDNSPESHLVIYSTLYLDDERNDFLRAGAASCLLKGMTLNELAAELRKICSDKPAIAAQHTI